MPSEFVSDATQRLVAAMRALGVSAEVAGMVAVEWRAGIVQDWGGERPYIGSDDGQAQRVRSRRDAALLRDWHAGERPPVLARRYGISRARVWQIVSSGQR